MPIIRYTTELKAGDVSWEKIIETLQRFIDNPNAPGLNFEKLRGGYNLYSIRINEKKRILLTKDDSQHGLSAWVVLEIMEDHKYERSRFLTKGVREHFLEKHRKEIDGDIEFERFVSETHVETPSPIELEKRFYYNQKFIKLDEIQQQTSEASLPLLISGVAGSGKSSVLMSILTQCLEKTSDKPILYITQSDQLIAAMVQNCVNIDRELVLLSTYDDLVLKLESPLEKEVQLISSQRSKEFFKNWVTSAYLPKYQQLCKTGLSSYIKTLENVDALYQELRVMSGYTTEEDYTTLGKRKSLWTKTNERKQLWNVYTQYQQHLKDHQIIDCVFYSFHDQYKGMFSRVLVDEAQDFANGQLASLANLAENEESVFSIDMNQSLFDLLSKFSYLEQLFHDRLKNTGRTCTIARLARMYRCPNQSSTLANAILKIKRHCTGGLTDKNEIPFIQLVEGAPEGEVHWISEIDHDSIELLKTYKNSASFAIVTDEMFMEEAIELFGTGNVYSPNTIKGLEFSVVLLYKPLEKALFKEANDLMAEIPLTDNVHLPKDKEGVVHEAKFGPLFNGLFTSCTRALQATYLFNHSKTPSKHLIECLKKESSTKEPIASLIVLPETSDLEWLEKIEELLKGDLPDKMDLIERIYTINLRKTKAEFQTFLKTSHPPNPITIEQTDAVPIAISIPQKVKTKSKKHKKTISPQPIPSTEEVIELSLDDFERPFFQEWHKHYIVKYKKTREQCIALGLDNVASELELSFFEDPDKMFDEFIKISTEGPKKYLDPYKALSFHTQYLDNNEYAFWCDLIRDPTEEKIIKLVKKEKMKDFLNIVVNKKTIYEYLLDSESGSKLFVKIMTSDEKYFTKIHDFIRNRCLSYINGLHVANKQEQKLLLSFLMRSFNIDDKLKEQPFRCHMLENLGTLGPDDDLFVFIIHWLATSDMGVFELYRFFSIEKSNPIMYKITFNHLSEQFYYSSSDDDSSKASMFSILSRSKNGIDILRRILKNHQDFYGQIQPNHLIFKDFSWCPLYLLCKTEEGKRLLTTIFQENPSLCQSVDPVAWFLNPKNIVVDNYREAWSCFDELNYLSGGFDLLYQLFEQNEIFYQKLTPHHLLHSLQIIQIPRSNRFTVMHSLILNVPNRRGLQFLEKAFEKNKKLAKSIPVYGWFEPCIKRNEPIQGENNVNLFRYLGSHGGIMILELILDENDDFINHITLEALLVNVQGAESFLSILLQQVGGIAFFNKILLKKPQFYQEIPEKYRLTVQPPPMLFALDGAVQTPVDDPAGQLHPPLSLEKM